MSVVPEDEGLWWAVEQLLRDRPMYTPALRDALLARFPQERVPSEAELDDALGERLDVESDLGPWRAAPDPHSPVPVTDSRPYRGRRSAAVVRTRRQVRPDVDAWASWLAAAVDDWSHDGLLLGATGNERTVLVVPTVRYGIRSWLAVRPLGPYHRDLDIRIRAEEHLGWRHLPAARLGHWNPNAGSVTPEPGKPLLLVYTNRQRVVLSNVLVHQLQALGCTGPPSTRIECLAIKPEEFARRAALQVDGDTERRAALSSYRAITAPGGRKLPVQTYCLACGQPLSDPASVERGYGPDCWERMTGDVRRVMARPMSALATALKWDDAIALTVRLLKSGRLAARGPGSPT